MLEDRHGLRQLDLVSDAVHADPRQPVGLVAQADVEGLAAGEQALEAVDVVGRRRRVDGRLVGVGQARGPALGQHAPALLAVARHELVASAVVPRARELEDLGLDVTARELGQAALGTVDREVHAHAVALGEDLVRVDRARVEAPAQEGAQALEQRRVVAALGQRDMMTRCARRRHGAPDAPRLGRQDHERDDRAAQVVGGCGEELVLGEGLEERDRRLVVVRADDEVLAGQDLAQLAVQDGCLGGGLGVGLGGEEADQARLADDLDTRRMPT